MRRKNVAVLLSGILVMSLLAAACGGGEGSSATREPDASGTDAEEAKEETQTVRFTHKYPSTHYFHEVIAEGIAADVAEATDGRITVEIFPAEQLIPEAEEITSVANGAVELSITSISEWHDFSIPANVTSLPFALSSFEQSAKLRGSEFEEMLTDMLESQESVAIVGYLEGAGVDSLVSRDAPLDSPEAFEGLRMRANNTDVGALFEKYGSPGLTQPVSDVYTSLERGTIDGAITIMTALVAAKWYEAAPYVTITPGWLGYAFYMLQANREWWDGLSSEDRAAFEEAFANAEVAGQEAAEQSYEEGLELLRELDGVTVTQVPEGQLEVWAEPGEFLYDEFREEWGEEGQQLLDAYLSVTE